MPKFEVTFAEILPSGILAKAKFGYVLDCPGRIGRIVKQAPTKCKITVKVKGIKAHAGNEPEKGLNAIKVAAFGGSLFHNSADPTRTI